MIFSWLDDLDNAVFITFHQNALVLGVPFKNTLEHKRKAINLFPDDRAKSVFFPCPGKRDAWVVHLAHKFGNVEPHDVVDAFHWEGADLGQFARPNLHFLSEQQHFLVVAAHLVEEGQTVAQTHHLGQHFVGVDEVDTVFAPADATTLDAELCSCVKHIVAHTFGKDEAQPILQPVLKHIADNQSDKKWQGEIAITLLEEERRQRGDNHGDAGCRTIEDLLDEEGVFAFVGVEVNEEIARFAQDVFKNDNRVEIVCGDIVNNIPIDGTVFYLFNPFNEKYLENFLKGIEKTIKNKVRLIYLHPTCRCIIDNNDSWRLIEEKRIKPKYLGDLLLCIYEKCK